MIFSPVLNKFSNKEIILRNSVKNQKNLIRFQKHLYEGEKKMVLFNIY